MAIKLGGGGGGGFNLCFDGGGDWLYPALKNYFHSQNQKFSGLSKGMVKGTPL